MLNLFLAALGEGADTTDRGMSQLGIVALIVFAVLMLVAILKFDWARGFFEFWKIKLGLSGGTHPPVSPTATASSSPATETVRIVMEQAGSFWDIGEMDGRPMVNVRLRATITNITDRPVRLVHARMLPDRQEGPIGPTRWGPEDFPDGDDLPPHRAMPFIMHFLGLPRSLAPAPGDVFVCAIEIVDQYDNKYAKRDVRAPYAGPR